MAESEPDERDPAVRETYADASGRAISYLVMCGGRARVDGVRFVTSAVPTPFGALILEDRLVDGTLRFAEQEGMLVRLGSDYVIGERGRQILARSTAGIPGIE